MPILMLLRAPLLITAISLASPATAMPQSADDTTPPRRDASRDRGPLAGPRVAPPQDADGAAPRDRARGERENRDGREREREAVPRVGGREIAELLAAVRRSEPTAEQQQAIRELLARTAAKTRTLAKESIDEMRQLLSIRRELLAQDSARETIAEVDARIAEARAKIVDPKSFEKQLLECLDPPRQSLVRAALEAARREQRGEPRGKERDPSTARERLRERAGPRDRRPPRRESAGAP